MEGMRAERSGVEEGPSVGMGRMHGSTARLADEPLARSAGPASKAEDLHPLAERLIREFRAPVGLLDPVAGSWQLRLGAEPEAFPRGGASLVAALTVSGAGPNRAVVWHPVPGQAQGQGGGEGPVWLVLPLARPGGSYLLAVAGFARTHGAD